MTLVVATRFCSCPVAAAKDFFIVSRGVVTAQPDPCLQERGRVAYPRSCVYRHGCTRDATWCAIGDRMRLYT